MRELNSKDYKLLKSLCGLSQKAMRKTLLSYLKSKYDVTFSKKEYLMAIGDIPIALVAHMDTVFKTPPTNIYYDRESGVIWSPEGLGADDRAGIFLILKILQSGFRPTVIFTADEEIGAIGAEALVGDLKSCPCELKYIIELDRRGTNDCVFYDCNNENFVKYIESFGFVEAMGSFSDISIICPDWGVAGVNLSVGYEDEHSYIETLHVRPMLKTLEKVIKMLQRNEIPSFEYIPKYSNIKWWRNPYSMSWEEDDDEGFLQCHKCGKMFPEYSLIPCYNPYGEVHRYCSDCCVDSINWCVDCGEPYDTKTCPHCEDKEIKKWKI